MPRFAPGRRGACATSGLRPALRRNAASTRRGGRGTARPHARRVRRNGPCGARDRAVCFKPEVVRTERQEILGLDTDVRFSIHVTAPPPTALSQITYYSTRFLNTCWMWGMNRPRVFTASSISHGAILATAWRPAHSQSGVKHFEFAEPTPPAAPGMQRIRVLAATTAVRFQNRLRAQRYLAIASTMLCPLFRTMYPNSSE